MMDYLQGQDNRVLHLACCCAAAETGVLLLYVRSRAEVAPGSIGGSVKACPACSAVNHKALTVQYTYSLQVSDVS
jgi:hypothetical protein